MRNKSAKELGEALSTYRANALTGGFIDDEPLSIFLAQKIEEDPAAPQLAKALIASGLGEGIPAMLRYWEFRDGIDTYQKNNNVSSISWREIDFLGERVRFPEWDDQLVFMPQDRLIMARHKKSIVAKYLNIVAKKNIPLVLISDDDEEMPIDASFVWKIVESFDMAMLRVFEAPVTYADDGTFAYFLREITLCLSDFPNESGTERTDFVKAIVREIPR